MSGFVNPAWRPHQIGQRPKVPARVVRPPVGDQTADVIEAQIEPVAPRPEPEPTPVEGAAPPKRTRR